MTLKFFPKLMYENYWRTRKISLEKESYPYERKYNIIYNCHEEVYCENIGSVFL